MTNLTPAHAITQTTVTNTSSTTTPEACVWWSITHAAWGCQIGNARSWHYNEADAIAHGERLAADVQRCSLIAGKWC